MEALLERIVIGLTGAVAILYLLVLGGGSTCDGRDYRAKPLRPPKE
ncbi:hypothetical protein ACW7BJ_16400 [Azospirillum argentinense]